MSLFGEEYGEPVHGLQLGIRASQRAYIVGADVPIEIKFRNTSVRPKLIRNRALYDFTPFKSLRVKAISREGKIYGPMVAFFDIFGGDGNADEIEKSDLNEYLLLGAGWIYGFQSPLQMHTGALPPGKYEVFATYENPVRGKKIGSAELWSGKIRSNSIAITIKEEGTVKSVWHFVVSFGRDLQSCIGGAALPVGVIIVAAVLLLCIIKHRNRVNKL